MIPEYRKTHYAIADRLHDLTRVSSALRRLREPLILTGCRDIWCRDFMPIQTHRGFVQFIYAPSYLAEDPPSWPALTVPGSAYPAWLATKTSLVPIVLDGGSIIGNEHVALVSERVLTDNPAWRRTHLVAALKDALGVDEIVWLPECPGDFTGHLDGTVRLVADSVMVMGVPVAAPGRSKRQRALRDAQSRYSESIRRRLHRLGLDIIAIADASHLGPASPEGNAFGVYANFLQIGPKALYMPSYGCEYDDAARRPLEAAGFEVSLIEASEFVDVRHPSRSGGAINCVTWTWQQ